jgi:hypothetical protein
MEANVCRRLKVFDESIGMGDLVEKFEIKKYIDHLMMKIDIQGCIVPHQMNRNVNHDHDRK